MRENCSRWYELVLRRLPDAVFKRGEMININGTMRGSERPKKTLIETIGKDLNTLYLTKHMSFYGTQ